MHTRISLNMYTYIFIASLRFLLCLLREKSFPWEESASHPTSLLLVKSECRKFSQKQGLYVHVWKNTEC